MAKYYFTYGSNKQFPFRDGWTEVVAGCRAEAVRAFRAYHPDVHEGIVNCASIYDEDTFSCSEMSKTGNFGVFCHEVIGAFAGDTSGGTEARALDIAARVMQAAGLCRYDSQAKCKRVNVPDDATCDRCIKSWLLSKAKTELKKELKKEK